MSGGNYYVPDSSRYPIFAATSLFFLVMGAGGTINGTDNGTTVLYLGFICMTLTMFFWFRTVVQEHLAGLDSAQLKKSYVFGMAWFIFSEVMFFAAFFGALFYVRTFAVPWLAGEGEKGAPIEFVQEMGVDFWTGFENTWPVIATPDNGSEYVIADKTMAFPGSRKSFNRWLGATVGLAVIFLALQAAEYYEAYAHYGLTLNSGIYGSTFFMLTGFHGFHVFLGCCMLSVMLVRSVFFNHFETHDHFGFEAASWYWHFVDVVWVMLFFFVYII
jgi:cytochrome c oxidase subunit 3